MFKKVVLIALLALGGLAFTAGEAQAYYPRYGRSYYGGGVPYYGYRYHVGPAAGYYVGWQGYGPYYNYRYRYYDYRPYVYPYYYGYPANTINYYGPRVGFSIGF
jgi:hypothetical protein